MAQIFLVEGRIPFAYRGAGMPFETYCEYSGPKALREYEAYVCEDRQVARQRLYFALNAALREFDMPVIQAGTGGVGQEVVDRLFNGPCRRALARAGATAGRRPVPAAPPAARA